MKPFQSPVNLFGRGIALSLGSVLCAGILSPVTAAPLPSPFPISQASPDEPPEVIIETEPEDLDTEPRFTCRIHNGEYTVMYLPESQPEQAYPWAVPQQLGGGWTPQKRCEAISQRLESYRPDGLIEMQTGFENNYDTVCVTTELDQSCRIVFTVPPGQDAQLIRDLVFENLATADQGDLTQGVNTFVEGGNNDLLNQVGSILNQDLSTLGGSNSRPLGISNGIDLRPFLDVKDGGTGRQLRRGVLSPQRSSPLNPDNFR